MEESAEVCGGKRVVSMKMEVEMLDASEVERDGTEGMKVFKRNVEREFSE
jgi:hypothetical protein